MESAGAVLEDLVFHVLAVDDVRENLALEGRFGKVAFEPRREGGAKGTDRRVFELGVCKVCIESFEERVLEKVSLVHYTRHSKMRLTENSRVMGVLSELKEPSDMIISGRGDGKKGEDEGWSYICEKRS